MSENTQPKNLKTIYMFKMIQGNKVRWKFEVDSQMVIINEGPAAMQEPAVQNKHTVPGPHAVGMPPDALAQYKRILEERGIKYSVTPQGQVIINEIPNDEKLIMQFFDLNAPCPEVEGMQELRSNYKHEYDQAGGAACPSCQLNTLQRKYRELLKTKVLNGAKTV